MHVFTTLLAEAISNLQQRVSLFCIYQDFPNSDLSHVNIQSKCFFPSVAIRCIIISDLTGVAGHTALSSTRVHYIRVLSALICAAVMNSISPVNVPLINSPSVSSEW